MTFVDKFRYYAKNETWTRLAPSGIHGIGVFAIRNIPENINPFPDCDNLFFEMPVSDLNRFPKSVRKLALDFLYVDENKIWGPDITLNQMNMNIQANENEINYWETQAQKELMDMLAELFGANLNMFYENFDNSKFNKAYKCNL